ncbi:OmpA family protein [Dysgonomonas sp. 216]|uniref:OmpA family protein n=1 Tax=Dysgonomonas sp. 216 TaxID=2302934 RepID=UPI0013CFDB68|nr:OmpA family protein [Dysgonomonas sp. 216]NDW18280.1 OmpA family protein [Dysgonomonas sp. 216]NDW18648.1 OmpA family protein [Dysgonomonas sp. 216]
MNQKTLLAILVMLSCNLSYILAQEESSSVSLELEGAETQEVLHNAYKTSWVKNRFKDTWYITFGSGVQTIIAEDDDKANFTDRLTYAPSITIGKYFSPIWGLRVQITGGSLHGFNDGESGTYRKWNSGSDHYQGAGYAGRPGYPTTADANFATWDPQWVRRGYTLDNGQIGLSSNGYFWGDGWHTGKLYMQHIKYAALNMNFMFDLLTLIGDYNPKRAFDITPFGGIAYSHLFPSWGYEAYDVIGANGGVNLKFRLGKKWDFNLEGNISLYPDDYDGHLGGSRSMDIVAQTTAGFTYKIGKSTWEVAQPASYDMIKDLNDEITRLRILAQQAKPCPDCPACPDPVTSVGATNNMKETKFLPDPVFFRIDKSIIDASEWHKIEKAVAYLNNHPDVNVVLTGYADRKTGYPAYNMRLSERRAKAVSKALVERYGVTPSRISINWEGDRIQPFDINAWNRVVVFVIEE